MGFQMVRPLGTLMVLDSVEKRARHLDQATALDRWLAVRSTLARQSFEAPLMVALWFVFLLPKWLWTLQFVICAVFSKLHIFASGLAGK